MDALAIISYTNKYVSWLLAMKWTHISNCLCLRSLHTRDPQITSEFLFMGPCIFTVQTRWKTRSKWKFLLKYHRSAVLFLDLQIRILFTSAFFLSATWWMGASWCISVVFHIFFSKWILRRHFCVHNACKTVNFTKAIKKNIITGERGGRHLSLKGKFSSGREGALASKFNYDFK